MNAGLHDVDQVTLLTLARLGITAGAPRIRRLGRRGQDHHRLHSE